MEREEIELWNIGIVNPEHIKSFIHCFCGAVLHECKYACNNDFYKGYENVFDTLHRVSRNHSEIGITSIPCRNDLLECLFNQKNEIPAYISYWFQWCYNDLLGNPSEYKNRHYDVYNVLQRKYIEQYRRWKDDEKYNRKFYKEERRQICKMYRSGEYSAAFKMYNLPFFENVSDDELDNLSVLMSNLFPKELSRCCDDGRAAALGYLIGTLGAAKLQS